MRIHRYTYPYDRNEPEKRDPYDRGGTRSIGGVPRGRGGVFEPISVLLIDGGEGWTLVDTGVRSSPGRIREALATLGGRTENLRCVFLTHHHSDHIGGLPGVREWAPDAELIAPEHDAGVISGQRGPDPPSNAILRHFRRYHKLPTTSIDSMVREGDVVASFRMVLTPGHTFGHASLLRDEDGLLFTGDAFGALLRRTRVGAYKAPARTPASQALRAEAVRGGVRHRGHEPRQTAGCRCAEATLGSSRPLRLLGAAYQKKCGLREEEVHRESEGDPGSPFGPESSRGLNSILVVRTLGFARP